MRVIRDVTKAFDKVDRQMSCTKSRDHFDTHTISHAGVYVSCMCARNSLISVV